MHHRLRADSHASRVLQISCLQIMGALAFGLKDIPWPKNLKALLMWFNGLLNIDVDIALDLSCVFIGFDVYTAFFVGAYVPSAVVVAVLLISQFQLCGKRSLWSGGHGQDTSCPLSVASAAIPAHRHAWNTASRPPRRPACRRPFDIRGVHVLHCADLPLLPFHL